VETLQDNFGVQIKKDWGYSLVPLDPPLPYIMTGILYGCQWEPGQWKLLGLQKVEESLTDLAKAMQGHFRGFIGPVTVISSDSSQCGRGYNCTEWGNRNIIFPPDLWDTWSVVHEFGHAWDRNHNWSLSNELMAYTGGHIGWRPRMKCDKNDRLPGCNSKIYFYGGIPPAGSDSNFNQKEDFAESVTAYVYPKRAKSKVEDILKDTLKNDSAHYQQIHDALYYSDYTMTPRWAFINGLVNP
jgi:hypothetical protein